jgi:long-chain acyl-CoA synthetase
MSSHSVTPESAAKIRKGRCIGNRAYEDRLMSVPSLGALLHTQAAKLGDKTYLIYRDQQLRESFSYKQFHEAVCRTANFLVNDLGLKPGERVSTVAYNHPATAIIYFATLLAGGVIVPINVGEEDKRIAFIQENSDCRIVFVMHDLVERYSSIQRPACIRHLVQIGGNAATGWFDWQKGIAQHKPQFDCLDLAGPESEALIVYTSGTTGPPKGVVLEHYNLLSNVHAMAEWHRFGADDRVMCVLPIHHVNGFIVTMITPMYVGGTMILNRKFQSQTYWEIIGEEQAACGSVVPTLLQFLCDQAKDGKLPTLPRLRYLICGAGPLTVELAQRFEAQFGIRIIHGYGLSETTSFNSFLPIDQASEEHARWLGGFGYPSIGCPISCNEMSIHDTQGRDVAEGEKGEIVIRGHDVMKYYLGRPDANETTFAHNWFRSGDEGFFRRDAQGRRFFFISGRIKELIIRGGINISPFEVDEVLNRIPGVRSAMAVGFDNKYYGEEVGAYVVKATGMDLSETEILRFCRAHLPFYQCPKVVVFGNDFPVTSTGKYKRNQLKPLFAKYAEQQFRETKA